MPPLAFGARGLVIQIAQDGGTSARRYSGFPPVNPLFFIFPIDDDKQHSKTAPGRLAIQL